ncbi:hypothetical protein ACFY3M_05120 [Streptomyces mirabilis]|uniref:hypothetical protein n=1 Tax=Streptomyces mirabilis TaxID=68239 RepID=UPI00368BACB7
MATSGSLQIEQIAESSAERIVCIVRCMGLVRPGDAVQKGVGGEVFSAHVGEIWFPGRRIDLLDPLHAAKIEFLGHGRACMSGFSVTLFPVEGESSDIEIDCQVAAREGK